MLPRGLSCSLQFCYEFVVSHFLFSFYSPYVILLRIVLLIPLKYHTGNRSCRLLQYNMSGIIPDIGIMVRVFANGLGDLGSIPRQVIPKTQKMVLDDTLLNTQHYKVRIKGKVEKSRERSSALPYASV